MVSMGVTSLYTIADGVFVGRFIGSEALAAVNLVMPLIMVSFALSDMIAVGSSVQIAIRLGQGNGEGSQPGIQLCLQDHFGALGGHGAGRLLFWRRGW